MDPVENICSRPSRRVSVLKAAAAPDSGLRDETWEGDLLSLLCVLETERTQLTKHCRNNQAVPALDAMLAMVRQVVAFAGVHLAASGGERMTDLRGRVEAFIAVALGLRHQLHKNTLQKLLLLLGFTSDEGDPRLQFVAAARGLLDVLAGY